MLFNRSDIRVEVTFECKIAYLRKLLRRTREKYNSIWWNKKWGSVYFPLRSIMSENQDIESSLAVQTANRLSLLLLTIRMCAEILHCAIYLCGSARATLLRRPTLLSSAHAHSAWSCSRAHQAEASCSFWPNSLQLANNAHHSGASSLALCMHLREERWERESSLKYFSMLHV